MSCGLVVSAVGDPSPPPATAQRWHRMRRPRPSFQGALFPAGAGRSEAVCLLPGLPLSFAPQPSARMEIPLQAPGRLRLWSSGILPSQRLSHYRSLTREKTATGSVNVRAFYVRRILRIWPLYFLALLLAFALPRLTQAPDGLIGTPQLLAYLFLLGNWDAVFHGTLPYVAVLWSISVEEQFYLAWPALARFTTRKTILSTSLAIWALSQMVVVVLCIQGRDGDAFWFNTLGPDAILRHRRRPQHCASRENATTVLGSSDMLMIAGGWALFVALPRTTPSRATEYFSYLAAGLGASLIFLASSEPRFRGACASCNTSERFPTDCTSSTSRFCKFCPTCCRGFCTFNISSTSTGCSSR